MIRRRLALWACFIAIRLLAFAQRTEPIYGNYTIESIAKKWLGRLY